VARLTGEAKGVYVIAATPFTEAGELDLASARSLIDFYLRFGIDGLTILGIMGEADKLSPDEARSFVAAVLERVSGRVPVIVGVSSPGIANLAGAAQRAMAAGAAGVMVAPIPSLKTEEQIYNYYVSVCEALGPDIPVVLQDYPPTTGVFMSVATIRRILAACPQIVMVKHEDTPGLAKLARLRRESGALGRRISILVGNSGMHLPQELARGADGAMTGFAYPEMLVETCIKFANGERERGEDIYDAYLPLVRHEAQPGFGLAIRKEVLRRRGAIASARLRAPGAKLDAADLAELDGLLNRLERRLASLGAASS
jgi:4-hydroxy-tetrahydrodipicolinate synthase